MASSTSAITAPTSFGEALDSKNTATEGSAGISLDSFLASLVSGLAVFGVEIGLFLLLHARFSRI